MMGKNISVYGIFSSRLHAENAIEYLKKSGFRHTDISCLVPENDGSKDFAASKETKAPEGVVTGGSAGAVIGGTIGWLLGAGAIFIPGFGPFVAAGPLMGALAGVGVGGTIGSITGALVGIGIPEYVAKRYAGMIKEGKILLSVHCDSPDWVKKAKDVLKEAGAADIGAANEAPGTLKGTNSDKPYQRSTSPVESVW